MLAFICSYVALSLLVGVVSIPGFLYGWKFCLCKFWNDLMLVCLPSWIIVCTFFVAYGFYSHRSTRKDGFRHVHEGN